MCVGNEIMKKLLLHGQFLVSLCGQAKSHSTTKPPANSDNMYKQNKLTTSNCD